VLILSNFISSPSDRKGRKKNKIKQLETVSIAKQPQNRQHAQTPNAVNTTEKGKEGGRVT